MTTDVTQAEIVQALTDLIEAYDNLGDRLLAAGGGMPLEIPMLRAQALVERLRHNDGQADA